VLRTTILALLFTFGLAAQGARVVLINIPVQTRQPGVISSPTVDIPADASGIVRIIADIPPADYADTANAFWIRLYQLDPSLQTWREVTSIHWEGGNRTDPELGVNPMPYSSLDIAAYKGRQMRVELDLQTRMRVGGQIDLGPTWPTDPHP